MNGSGITYEDVITNDKIEELQEQLSQLQQEKEEVEADLYASNMIINELLSSNEELIRHCKFRKEFIKDEYQVEEENAFECCIEELDLILSKLKESDKDVS